MPTSSARVVVTFLAAATLAGCAIPLAGEPCAPGGFLACDSVVITVSGPRDWMPEETYSVELAGVGLRIDRLSGGGVVQVLAPDGAEVRVYEVASCTLVTVFTAPPATAHHIRFDQDGGAAVEEITGQAIDAGPGIEPGAPSGCDAR